MALYYQHSFLNTCCLLNGLRKRKENAFKLDKSRGSQAKGSPGNMHPLGNLEPPCKVRKCCILGCKILQGFCSAHQSLHHCYFVCNRMVGFKGEVLVGVSSFAVHWIPNILGNYTRGFCNGGVEFPVTLKCRHLGDRYIHSIHIIYVYIIYTDMKPYKTLFLKTM